MARDGITIETHHGKKRKRAYQWVPWWPGYPDGRLMASKRYRLDVPNVDETLEHWCEDIKVEARKREAAGEFLEDTTREVTGFAEDVERYIDLKFPAIDQHGNKREDTQPYKARVYIMRLWVALFGERDHTTIKAIEIQTQCNTWITRGPKWVYVNGKRVQKPIPLSAQEVNLRLRALENHWTMMYPTEKNIVREVAEFGEAAEAKPRGQTFKLCYELLEYMPDF